MHKIRTIYIVFCMSICMQSKAHSPTEIGFKFLAQNDQVYLEVHLTSITLFDLLGNQFPELKNAEALNLSNYMGDYSRYFNEQLEVSFNNIDRRLIYESSHLNGHDVYLKFLVSEVGADITSYALQVNAFSFYQSPKFTVLYDMTPLNELYILDKTNKRCFGELKPNRPLISEKKMDDRWMFVFLPLIVLIAWVTNSKVLAKV